MWPPISRALAARPPWSTSTPRPAPPSGATGGGAPRSWAPFPPPRRSGAGLVVIDTVPGLFDIAALDATARLCALASLPFAVVLNHVPPRGRTTDLAEAAVRDYGAEVAPARIGARAAFAHCLPLGLSVAEAYPRSKAAGEIRAFGAWLRHHMGNRNA